MGIVILEFFKKGCKIIKHSTVLRLTKIFFVESVEAS